MSVDAEAIACAIAIEAQGGPKEGGNFIALQIALPTFTHLRQCDNDRTIEPLVPPAPISLSAAESVTSSRLAVDVLIVRPLL